MTSITLWQQITDYSANIAQQIIASQFFQHYGLVVLFLYVAFPLDLLPIPLETFMLPLIAVKIPLQVIFAVAWIGEIFGSVGLYYFTKWGFRLYKKGKVTMIAKSHFAHRHRWWIFAIAPVVYVTGDAMMVYAGIKHMPVTSFIIPLSIGIFFRTLIALLITLGIFTLPQFLK